MSQLETIQNIYAAFARGDVPTILSKLAEDVRWEDGVSVEHAPWLRPGRGLGHVGQFFQIVGRDFEFKQFEIGNVMAAGNQVVALAKVEFVYKPTGKTVRETCEVHVWTFGDDGKITGFRHVVDTAQHANAAKK